MKKCHELPVEELSEWLFHANSEFQVIRAFVNIAPMPAILKDSAGRVLHVNRLGEKMLGISLRDVLGKTTAWVHTLETTPEEIEKEDRIVLLHKLPHVSFHAYVVRGVKARYSVLKFAFVDSHDNSFVVAFMNPPFNIACADCPQKITPL